MKRALVLTALLAVAAVAGALAYRAAARDRSYRTLIASGEAALAAGETLAAIEDFSGAIAVRPDAMLARLRRGETYRQRGDYDVAARDFRAAAALDPTATRPLELLGDVLFAQERFHRAADTYQARLSLDDHSALVRYKLALARYRDGQLDAALTDARAAIALDDRSGDARYLAALCLRDQGHRDEALALLREAVERAPGLVPAREELADLYAAEGRYTEQVQQLQVLAGLEGRRVERQVAVGLAQAKAGKADLAVATLTAALEQTTDQALVNAALGRVWLQVVEERRDGAEALGKALEALERAASALNATSEIKTLYGRALALSGQLDAAEQVFQQAVERYPLDPSAFPQLATVAQQLGHHDVARTALMDYVALTGPDTIAAGQAARIGALSVTLHDWPTAIPWLQKAVAERPTDIGLLGDLAHAQIEAGELRGARVSITRAQLLDAANLTIAALDQRLTTRESTHDSPGH
ncbi:MAG: tetratricopeptide repeat protein [Acidobacteria bacterium]|nr:tetratricopeptide repeat protein [Acidobacteriota bacterium]